MFDKIFPCNTNLLEFIGKSYFWWLRYMCIEYEFSVCFLTKKILQFHLLSMEFHFINWIPCSSQSKCHMHSFLSGWFDRNRNTYCSMYRFSLLVVRACANTRVENFSVSPSILNNNKINNSISFHPIRFIAFVSLFCLFRRFRWRFHRASLVICCV